MKKTGIILSVIGVLVVVLIATVAIVYAGNDAVGLNYVKLSINPKIEFICDGTSVVSYNAINEEAKELCAQEVFVGLKIEDACASFVDLATRAGYIDVDKSDNAIKIDCVSGLSQALEVKVYTTLIQYLKENQILGAVIESANDNETVTQAQENKISVDKLVLCESLAALDNSNTIDSLKGQSVASLINQINAKIEQNGNPSTDYTEEDLTNKRVLIDLNRVKYAEHLNAITNESQAEFGTIFTRNEKTLKKQIQSDFDTAYNVWKNNHVNFVS